MQIMYEILAEFYKKVKKWVKLSILLLNYKKTIAKVVNTLVFA